MQGLERNQIWVDAVGLLLGCVLALPGLGSAFLQVAFRELRRAFAHGRYMAAALALNFLVVPAVSWSLARLAPQDPAVILGVYLGLLTPCIDYVIVFAGIGGGEEGLVLASTPALMLLQMLLLPFYLWLFMGAELVVAVDLTPAVVVTQTLVELAGLLVYVRLVPSWLLPGEAS